MKHTVLMLISALIGHGLGGQPVTTPTALPDWAVVRWQAVATSHVLRRSSKLTPNQLRGDFDGDGAGDVAVVVESRTTGKVGIAFLHQRATAATIVVGAGRTLGNGGDDFSWADSWMMRRQEKSVGVPLRDAVLLEREGSGGGLLYYALGRYHWRQRGD